jgi:hypothetical protein
MKLHGSSKLHGSGKLHSRKLRIGGKTGDVTGLHA